MNQIYLDNCATTRPYLNLFDTVKQVCENSYANPSSKHFAGVLARGEVEDARAMVADTLNCNQQSIIFTSGGTEANNLAIRIRGMDLYCSTTEHNSIIQNSRGCIPVLEDGTIDIDKLDTFLKTTDCRNKIISIMLVNNETGVILDPQHKIKILKERYGFIYHVDAVQAFGKYDICYEPELIGADLLTLSGHKIHAFSGVGALYIRDDLKKELAPIFGNSSHEFGIRSGTENMAGIVSLGIMCQKIKYDSFYHKQSLTIRAKRDMLETLLKDISIVNGSTEHRVSNISNLYFDKVKDLDLFLSMLSDRKLYVSGMSACSSGLSMPSKVLTAMYGADSPRLTGSIRFSLSIFTTVEEIKQAAQIVRETIDTINKTGEVE